MRTDRIALPLREHAARRALPVALVVGCFLASAVAQEVPPAGERAASAFATLPESNEALLLTGEAEAAIRRGEFRLAIELIGRIRSLPAGLVASPASRTFYPLDRQATRLLRMLPDAGVEMYRQLLDSEVGARLEEAVRAGDMGALRELFGEYPLSSHWQEIGWELVARQLDSGQFADAVGTLREMRAAQSGASPELEAQMIVALGEFGAIDSARSVLETLSRSDTVRGDPQWAGRLEMLRGWLDEREQDGFGDSTAAALEPRLRGQTAWTVELAARGETNYWDEDVSIDAVVEYMRRLPLLEPVLADDTLLLRSRGMVRAIDAWTLTPLWSAAEIRAIAPDGRTGQGGFRDGRFEGGAALEVSNETELLLTHPLRHALSTAFGLVYTVERLGPSEPTRWNMRRPPFGQLERPMPNELVARELSTGRVVWRSGNEGSGKFFGAVFQDAPVAVGQRLVVPLLRGDEMRVAAIEPKSGELIEEMPIVGPPTRYTGSGGRALLLTDETTIYVFTGNGVVAALGRDFSWKWAAVYPSTLGEHLGRFWWDSDTPTAEPGFDRPLLAGELLIGAPLDSNEIFAIDRFSGLERWRVPRGEHLYLVGAVQQGLVVGGSGLTCLDPADGRTVRWKTISLPVCGRPMIRDEQIFVPTRWGLMVVDGRTGKVIAEAGPPGESPAGQGGEGGGPTRPLASNVILSADSVLTVSPNRVSKYPDAERLRARCEQRLAARPEDARARLALSWLDAFEGRFAEAVERLDALTPEEPALRTARDRLLARTCMALAQQASSGPQRLTWLREASSLAQDPAEAARAAALIGRAIEEAGLIDEAVGHYESMLLNQSPGFMVPADSGRLSTAGWLVAAQRLGRLLRDLPTRAREDVVAKLVSAAGKSPEDAALLFRVRQLLPEGRQRDEIDRQIALRPIAPELAKRFLPGRSEGQSAAAAELLLRRWDVHVSLGLLEAAQADEAAWREYVLSAGAAVDEAQRELAARIEIAQRKLEHVPEAPLARSVRREWVARDARLLLQPWRPDRAALPTVLVQPRNSSVINLYRLPDGTPLRETEAALSSERAAAAELAVRALFGGGGDSGSEPFAGRAALVHGHLAAIAVRGGVLCLGLGSERYGGRRLWEHAVPEWRDLIESLSERGAAGDDALYFTPRPDRVCALDWLDGRIRWQRDLPGLTIQRLELVGDRLVVIGADQQVFSMRADSGEELRRLELETASVHAALVAHGRLVVSGTGFVMGVDAATMEPAWTLPGVTIDRVVSVSNSPWVLIQPAARLGWMVVDVESGARLVEEILREFEAISAAHFDGQGLDVAGRGRAGDEPRSGGAMLARIARDGWRQAWLTNFVSLADVNVTQLSASEALVPVLVLRPAGDGDGPDPRSLAVELYSRQDGSRLEEIPLGEMVDTSGAPGEVYMLVTPTRILVQAYGHLVALGSSAGNQP